MSKYRTVSSIGLHDVRKRLRLLKTSRHWNFPGWDDNRIAQYQFNLGMKCHRRADAIAEPDGERQLLRELAVSQLALADAIRMGALRV